MSNRIRNWSIAGVALVLLAVTAPASAMVINFDDIPSPGCCFFPGQSNYLGFTWGGGSGDQSWVVADEGTNVFPGIEAHSPENYAWSNGATDLSLTDGTFTFVSAWMRGGNSGFNNAFARGFLNNVEIFTQSFGVTQQYQEYVFNFTGIDRLEFTNQGTNLLLDDITIVPEPATLVLLGLGLAGLGMRRRKRA